MENRIVFFIKGKPVPKGRHRLCRGKDGRMWFHNPKKNDDYERNIKNQAFQYLPRDPLDGPIQIHLVFRFLRPKSRRNFKEKWHIVRPDKDNLEKGVTDPLKKMGFFKDDCQLCDGRTMKIYTDDPTKEGVIVGLVPLNQIKMWDE